MANNHALLKICPYCKNEMRVISPKHNKRGNYWVACPDCGARTSHQQSYQEAVERWNDRLIHEP